MDPVKTAVSTTIARRAQDVIGLGIKIGGVARKVSEDIFTPQDACTHLYALSLELQKIASELDVFFPEKVK